MRAFCESGVLFHMSHLKLHFALHTSHCTLHTPHFISSELFSPYPSSSLLISSLLICRLSFHESSTTSKTFMRRAPARPVRACFVRSCCSVVVQEHDLRATPAQCNAKRKLSSHSTLHYSHFTLHTSSHLRSCELFSPHLTSSQLFSSHPIASHMSSKKVLLNCFHLIRALINLSHLPELVLNSSQLFCTPESSYCQHTEAFTLYTGKASGKYLCTTKLRSSPQLFYIHHSQGSPTLLYWPLSRTTPPSSPSRLLLRHSVSTHVEPASSLYHPGPPRSGLSSRADMSDSSVYS